MASIIEVLPFDPAASKPPPGRPGGGRSHRLIDAGGLATLALLLGGFVAPAVTWAIQGTAQVRAGSGFEMRALLWGALLALLLPVLQVAVHIGRYGGPQVRGNRERYPVADRAAGRIARAHANLVESLAPFSVAVLAAQMVGVSNRWTVAASALYLAARLVHATAYTLGVTVIRSAAFYAGVFATVAIILQLVLVLR